MKAIMISIKPKWCALEMNDEKSIEVRTSKALATAIQKLIDKYGYADIYVYCCKDDVLMKNIQKTGYIFHSGIFAKRLKRDFHSEEYPILNGKVLFKFRCYKVDKWDIWQKDLEEKLKFACLSLKEFDDYSKGQVAYAIHISDLEIFDSPRELCEFYKYMESAQRSENMLCMFHKCNFCKKCQLTKAPQNFCYVEVEK